MTIMLSEWYCSEGHSVIASTWDTEEGGTQEEVEELAETFFREECPIGRRCFTCGSEDLTVEHRPVGHSSLEDSINQIKSSPNFLGSKWLYGKEREEEGDREGER